MLETNGLDAAATEWSTKGIWLRGHYRVDQLPGFQQGLFQVQGEASQLIGWLLAPQAGETVLDACAAPGGKATHIAELMKDTGTIIAADISPEGIEKINENKIRLGHGSIETVKADLTQAVGRIYERTYDRILLDAPCSGLGTLRSHPEIKWNRTRADLIRLQQLQKRLLSQLASRLKPEGVLVYSTCTLSRTENEDVVEDFLAHHSGFLLEDAKNHLPGAAKGLTRGKYFLALPHRHNTDGFFAARISKVG
jgi:16S rRNA (cytosine967-C5)-methyltransferase